MQRHVEYEMKIMYLKGRGRYNNWCSWTLDHLMTSTSCAPHHSSFPTESFLCSQLFLPPASSLSPQEAHLVTSQSYVVCPWGKVLEATAERKGGYFPGCREEKVMAYLASCFIPKAAHSPEGCFFHHTFGLIINQMGSAGW